MTKTISIETERVGIDLATGFGPRVIALRPDGGDNLFAEFGDLGIDLPDGRRFLFRGGHRLWLAPEVPESTYEPDDDPVDAGGDDISAYATGHGQGVEKTIRVSVNRDAAVVTVDHFVTNRGDRPLETALWAITQFRTGGIALLPLTAASADPHGLQASARVVGWPYTDWGALESEASVLYVRGTRDVPTKVGTPLNSRGWLAYVIDGWLFAKYAEVGESPLDLGATAQIYVNTDFVELETLAEPVILEPDGTTLHREVWRIWPAPGSLRESVALAESAV